MYLTWVRESTRAPVSRTYPPTCQGIQLASVRARRSAQMKDDERRAHADLVIDNDGSLDELRVRVSEIWAERFPLGR